NLIKQTEKLTILNETDEEEQLEDVIINVLGDRSAEKSNVTSANSLNIQTETEPRRAVGSETADAVGRAERILESNLRFSKDHPVEQVIGSPSAPVRTRGQMNFEFGNSAFISHIEPKKISEALADP
ncbi:hypothetical protein RF074_01445, partial [Serratia marcescens]|uniref:hypothetical protein n=1 Tax=Serratia marcescens TaxID=615 RepID=UPI002812994D